MGNDPNKFDAGKLPEPKTVWEPNAPQKYIENALAVAGRFGNVTTDYPQKAWIIDQMVRALFGGPANYDGHVAATPAYTNWIAQHDDWDTGVSPL